MTGIYGMGTVEELIKGKKYRIQLPCGKDPVTGKYLRVRETFIGTKRQAELRIEQIRRERIFAGELLEAGYSEDDLAEHDLSVALACKSGMSVKEVCSEIERQRKAALEAALEAARSVTFAEWCEKYLSNRESMGKKRKATLKKDRCQSKHLLAFLGDVKLRDITPMMVSDLYVALYEAGIGDTTVHQCHALLKRMMTDALKKEQIDRNPVIMVEAPKNPKPNRKALQPDEIRRFSLITGSTPTANNVCAFLGMALGARLGEVLGLTWEHAKLDEPKPYVHIVQQHTRYDERTALKTDKDENPVGRIVPIDSSTVAVLKAWKAAQRALLNSLGIEQGTKTPIVTNALGGWMEHSDFERWWRIFCVDNGFGTWKTDDGRRIIELEVGTDAEPYEGCLIEWHDADGWSCDSAGRRYSRTYKRPKVKRHYEGLKFHELRHSHFTKRLADGMDIPTAQALGGWSSPRILMEVYAHPVNEKVWQSAGFMDAICTS